MKAKNTAMNKEELAKINDAMPSEAKYGDVFQAIAQAQAEISFPAGRQAEAKELEGIVQFAYKVAVAMDALRSSHVFFILQQAFGDETEWSDSQEILTNIITRGQAKLQEWEFSHSYQNNKRR